jgi:hypothetical protein
MISLHLSDDRTFGPPHHLDIVYTATLTRSTQHVMIKTVHLTITAQRPRSGMRDLSTLIAHQRALGHIPVTR